MASLRITKCLLIAALFAAACITAQAQGIFIYSSYMFTPQAGIPTFSPAAGTYSSTQTVTISTATSLAVLCYTTDGTTPTESANLCSGGTTATYSTPITVSTTQTVKAIATLATYTDSSVGGALYTISAGTPSPNSGTGTVCQHSSGSALAYTYTPAAVGDGMVFTFAEALTTKVITGVADNGGSGGSSYTILAAQVGSARTTQNIYTTSFHSGVTTITFTPTASSASFSVCGQEFSNMTGFANTGETAFTGGAYSGTQLTCTLANTTDYLYLGGGASSSVTGFTTGPNGTLVGTNTAAGMFLWAQYVLNAQGTGTLNYTGGSVNLACGDVQ
jgi:hypothetical protein